MTAAVRDQQQEEDPAPTRGRMVGARHLFPCRVYFEDTDLSGVVYHANYLRFMERARSDMLALAGIDQRAAFEAGEGAFAIADLSIRYHAPARLEDALVVESRIVDESAARVVIQQTVRRGTVNLTRATVTAALVGSDGRPRRQPARWRQCFRDLIVASDQSVGDQTP